MADNADPNVNQPMFDRISTEIPGEPTASPSANAA
jgi:hypothetical protein